MKLFRVLASICTTLSISLLCSVPAHSQSTASNSPAETGLGRLKSLAGQWSLPLGGTKDMRITYAVVGNGSAVTETHQWVESNGQLGDPTTITVYYVKDDELMVTHYDSDNQPRMRANVPPGTVSELDFEFVDGANSYDNHMHRLLLNFVDPKTISVKWVRYEQGKREAEMAYTATRMGSDVNHVPNTR
jgi:hypothetical protein